MKNLTLLGILCLFILAPGLYAQTDQPVDDSIVLPLIATSNQPSAGTYWLWSYRTTNNLGIPIPWNPWGTNVNVYAFTNEFIGQIQYIIDDTPIIEAQAEAQSQNTLSFGAFSSSEDESSGSDAPSGISFPSNSLWLELTSVANASDPNSGTVFLTIHGTTEDQTYEILSRDNMTNTGWNSEGTVVGAAGQDWTATTVSTGLRTNTLFMWARSYIDTDGDGLPDWWELENGLDPNSADTGDTGIPDGDKDLAGDGWTTIYKYQHGIGAHQSTTPPPPQNVRAIADWGSATVNLSWDSGGGSVAYYGVELDSGYGPSEIATNGIGTRTYTDHQTQIFLAIGSITYWIRAYLSSGGYVESARVTAAAPQFNIFPDDYAGDFLGGGVIRGADCLPYLTMLAPPPDLSYVTAEAGGLTGSPATNINLSEFTNGIAALPVSIFPYGEVLAQAFGTNGAFGNQYWLNQDFFSEDESAPYVTNFINAAAQMKENLRFLLRAATGTEPFSYISNIRAYDDYDPYGTYSPWAPELGFGRPAGSPDYAYYGFHQYSSNLNYGVVDLHRPVREHYRWRNFLWDSAEFAPGWFDTGADGDVTDIEETRSLYSSKFKFAGSFNNTTNPLSFTASQTTWILAYDSAWVYGGPTAEDVIPRAEFTYDGTDFHLSTGARNCFGLPLESMRAADTELFYPGDSVPDDAAPYFTSFQTPGLQITNYYFASQTPYFAGFPDPYGYGSQHAPPPLPGSPSFSPTNAPPLLIAPFGRQYVVSGWAQMAITNGYSNKFAYLEQFFGKAYTMTNGSRTTNQTGVLSPYGEFFPTIPGPTALVTMPDIDTGETGTGVVNVIKLQLDVNHDGTMDLSFGGPDNTSQTRPYVFWVNDDWDASGHDVNPQNKPRAHDYTDALIGTARDLEDFARLWIVGLPDLPSDSGYAVSLNWQNTTGDPAIRLFRSCETNGGTAYLTDTNVAATQAIPSGFGRAVDQLAISSSLPFTFPSNFFATHGTNSFLLWEGVSAGSGELVLTVAKGTNILARTSAWLDLHDIRDLYEKADVTNVITTFPASRWSTRTSTFVSQHEISPPADESKQAFVFVHGWNDDEWQCANYAQTCFKRLYWQGYHGRFAALKWPALIGVFTYNPSELVAWRSGQGASDYFNWLRSRLPGYSIGVLAHSMGGVVMTEALRIQLAAGSNAVDNCIFTQAALPAHCFDADLPDYPLFNSPPLQSLPDTYRGYPGAISDAVSGSLVNFFNTNDFALATGLISGIASWEDNEVSYKPDTGNSYSYSTDGTPYFGFNVVTDPRELMSFIARPHSKAVGAQGGALGTVGGNIEADVDLTGEFNFRDSIAEHSAQFNWNIQRIRGYYAELLATLFPQ